MMLVTSGRNGFGSSASADLQRCLESRLMQRLDTAGSTLWDWTWRAKATPLRRRYFQRQVLERRTSATGFSSVPTPNTADNNASRSQDAVAYSQRWMERDAHGSQLAHVAQALAAVPTPQTHDDKLRGNTEADCHYSPHDLSNAAILASVPTPMAGSPATETYNTAGNTDYSRRIVELAAMPTPNAMEGGQTSRSGKRKGELLMGGIAKLATITTPSATDGERGGTMTPAMSGQSLTQKASLSTVPVAPMSRGDGTSAVPGTSAPVTKDCDNFENRLPPMLAPIATPRNEDSQCAGAHRGLPDTLHSQANLASISTPSARDWKDTSGMSESGVDPDGSTRTRLDQLPRQAQLAASGPTATGGTGATASTGQLDPAYSRWLMGVPPEWDGFACTATRSVSQRRRSSSMHAGKRSGSTGS